MKVIDHVYDLLKQQTDKRLTTKEIAQLAGLSRSVTSGYLSRLYQRNLVTKTGTRPIYWKYKEKEPIFSEIIGYDGSLKNIMNAVLQSILYPPNGLPITITGPSGSGKSMLAKKIYQKAIELKIVNKKSSFVALNTADYANNTELLSSVLFGYKKGAFTGADQDTPGLLDKADGGYLFLDEVHRLSKTNQEKLFSLLDYGTFYPLGQVDQPHHVNVRLIMATTENLKDYLLRTFLRRIPLQVELPSFIDRPYAERMQLVTLCFKNEARKTGCSYTISSDILNELCSKNYPGNIGTLDNKIKLLCAQEFTSHTNESIIPIGKATAEDHTLKINKNFVVENLDILLKSSLDNLQATQDETIQAIKSDYNISDCKLIILKHLRTFSRPVEQKLPQFLYLDIKKSIKMVLNDIYGVDPHLTKEETDQLSFAFSLGKFQKNSLQHTHELEKLIQQKYPRSFYLYKKFLKNLSDHIFDSYYLWFFPLFANLVGKIEQVPYTCILLAHGESTATSIQKVTNNLVENYVFEAFDMPVSATIDNISKKVTKYINMQKANNNGTILLFDMGSLNQFFVKIKNSSNKQLLVVNNLTTAIALDIAIRALRPDSFEEIVQEAKKYGTYIGIQYFEGLSDQDNIIVSCLSGSGLSIAFKNIMQKTLSSKKKIFTIDYHKLRKLLDNKNRSFFKNTKLIITTTDFKSNFDIPIINIYNILDENGFNELKHCLLNTGEESDNVNKLLERFLKFLTIEGIKDRLQFLNPNVVIEEVQSIVEKYQKYYDCRFSGKVKLNLYMHLSLMIERVLLNKDSAQNKSSISYNSKSAKEFSSISKTVFKPIEMKYNVKINDFEISLIYELVKDLIEQ